MSKTHEAGKLYERINRAYKPIYFPTEEEKNEAIMVLAAALYSKVNPEEMVRKAEILAKLHGNHKSKVTNIINNKFWQQEFEYGVVPRKFKEDE